MAGRVEAGVAREAENRLRPLQRALWLVRRDGYIVRFDIHQRAQHLVMMTTFLILALTGLPQKFHELGVSQWLITSLGGLERVQFIHHTAAWVLLVDCTYHLLYISHTILIRQRLEPLLMVPSPKDIQDMGRTILHWFGFSTEKPKSDRFSYLEKFDYWAVFWGIAIIGGSGLIMMFATFFTRFLPGGIIPAANAAHSDEAVLAVGWIFLVHIVRSHLYPGIFPANPSIFTGQVPIDRYQEEHPLEFQRLLARNPALLPGEGHFGETVPAEVETSEAAVGDQGDPSLEAAPDAAVEEPLSPDTAGEHPPL
ncbi:MAG TPA: hypothetical protein VJO15_02915 [Dehalococcoidia bacterium]|nr:hypothetical protein [Dehalococcoidia bacterium]